MTRHVWVIQSAGGGTETAQHEAGRPSARQRSSAGATGRRFGLRSRGKKAETPPSSTGAFSFPPGWEGITATPDIPRRESQVEPTPSVTDTEWLDAEPEWLDPNGPRQAQGPDPSWTIYRGTLVGGPLRWVLRRGTDPGSQWRFLSVSGKPTSDEFTQQIAAIAGWDAAVELVEAIRTDLPDCIAEPDDAQSVSPK